jgi:hypothetical protein
MIHVERPQEPPSIPLYRRKTRTSEVNGVKVTPAQWETERAIRFFANPAHFADNQKLTDESFEFEVYRNKPLRRKLTGLFHSKCAYCESSLATVAPADIEHFRPKKKIKAGSQALMPGYYWLATEWHNLLLSCQFCNRTNYHQTPDQPSGQEINMGKVEQFPLSTEVGRVRSHTQDLADEEPYRLLLNPCTDDPEKHLLFRADGIVKARQLEGGGTSQMGQASIAVYALQRKGLVEAREERARDLIITLENLCDAAFNYRRAVTHADDEAKERSLRSLDRNAGRLRSYLEPKAPCLALVRQIIGDQDQQGEFETLKPLGIDPAEMVASSIGIQ